jgi:hypothetical protein
MGKFAANESSAVEGCPAKISVREVRLDKGCVPQIGAAESRATHIAVVEDGLTETCH